MVQREVLKITVSDPEVLDACHYSRREVVTHIPQQGIRNFHLLSEINHAVFVLLYLINIFLIKIVKSLCLINIFLLKIVKPLCLIV